MCGRACIPTCGLSIVDSMSWTRFPSESWSGETDRKNKTGVIKKICSKKYFNWQIKQRGETAYNVRRSTKRWVIIASVSSSLNRSLTGDFLIEIEKKEKIPHSKFEKQIYISSFSSAVENRAKRARTDFLQKKSPLTNGVCDATLVFLNMHPFNLIKLWLTQGGKKTKKKHSTVKH